MAETWPCPTCGLGARVGTGDLWETSSQVLVSVPGPLLKKCKLYVTGSHSGVSSEVGPGPAPSHGSCGCDASHQHPLWPSLHVLFSGHPAACSSPIPAHSCPCLQYQLLSPPTYPPTLNYGPAENETLPRTLPFKSGPISAGSGETLILVRRSRP